MAAKKSFALTGSTVMLLVGAVALAAALYWVVFLGRGAQAPVAGEADAPAVVAEQDTPEAEAEDAPEAALLAAPEDEVEAEAEADTEVASDGPSFDVVRIDHQGVAVIAGNAAPGAEVILLADDTEVARVTADRTGKFVALFDMPPSDAPRSLSAQMRVDGGEAVASAGAVLIAPVRPIEVVDAAPKAEPVVVEPEAEADVAVAEAEGAVDVADTPQSEVLETEVPAVEVLETGVPEEDAPIVELVPVDVVPVDVTPVDAAPASPEPQEPESPTIVLADDSGVRVLQGAAQPAVPTTSPQVAANLVIDTITYNEGGDVALTGRGQGEGFARVYLDDRPVQTVQIAPDGTWRTPLPDVDAGVYRLRIDELDAEGTVTSRVETPFQREEPEIAAAAAGRPNVVTVQEGFTLWAIAEDQFGDGVDYIRVYEANRDLIRDPDLIYPGQVFALPEGDADSEG